MSVEIKTTLENTPEISIEEDTLYATIRLFAKVKLEDFDKIMDIVKLQKDGTFKTTLEKIS